MFYNLYVTWYGSSAVVRQEGLPCRRTEEEDGWDDDFQSGLQR